MPKEITNKPNNKLSSKGTDIVRWFVNYIEVSPESESSVITRMLIEDAKNGYGLDFGLTEKKGSVSFMDLM